MSYWTQKIVAEYTNEQGVQVILREGLNNQNDLELRLVVPRELKAEYDPELNQFRYSTRNNLYFAQHPKGVVHYLCASANEDGFYGATYELTMEDGSIVTLKGPWSSRSEVLNRNGFTPCKEVNIACLYNMAGNMTVERINELIAPLNYKCVPGHDRPHRYEFRKVEG